MASVERADRPLRSFLMGVGIALVLVAGAATTWFGISHSITTMRGEQRQEQLDPFYRAPVGWRAEAPGTLLRREPVAGVPAGGLGWRVLYVTQRADGSPAVSSGLVFAPRASAAVPDGGRPVLSWAHPTVGMGDACAPSRTPVVESDVPGLSSFLGAGWVVAATDYAGLGTAGTEQYLVGLAEAHDLLNAVRAARAVPAAHAGTTTALFGHSQGGHAVLWAAAARSYAPELDVVADVAAAPAAELVPLISRQWSSIYGSLIGAEVLVSYPDSYAGLGTSGISRRSTAQIEALASRCLEAAVVDIAAAKVTGRGPLLDRDPLGYPRWRAALAENTPPPPTIPTLIVQGTADPIVLPGSTALYVERSCAAGSPVDAAFVGTLGHIKAGQAAAPLAFTWLQQRLGGVPTTSTCGTSSPIRPFRP